MISCHLLFWPVIHPMPYWGIFPFRMRFTDLHGGHVLTCSMIDDFMSANFWLVTHSMSYWGIFSFRMRFMDLHGGHMFDDKWFLVARSSTYHTFDAIMGHISVLDEIYRSWWICMLILICETYAETMIYLLSLRWFLREAFQELPS